MSTLGGLLCALVIFALLFSWSVRVASRITRHVAPMLESPRMSWDGRHSVVLLDGIWEELPVRIQSSYGRGMPLCLSVRVGTSPPELEARVTRSERIELRSVRHDRLGIRTLARVVDDELSMSGPPARAAIAEYFTPTRLQSLRVLFDQLGWTRFVRNEEAIEVWRWGGWHQWGWGGGHIRWKPDEARHKVRRTLLELQKMEPGW